jgi:drug/metabolite transporter (DMT)-like permease
MASFIFPLLIGIIAISTASILIKLCDAPALIISTYRMVFASLILMPWASYQKVWRGWEKRDFVGIGSWLFLKESLGFNLILGIGLSVVGSGLIGYGDMALSKEALMGDGLALLGALAASGYFLVGRKMRRNQNLLAYIFPVYSTAGLVLILLSLFFQKPLFGYSSNTYLILFLLAVVPQLIGHTTFNWALKYLPASMIAITILGEPIGSTILAYFILGEGLTLWKVLGGISIFAGILIALKKEV